MPEEKKTETKSTKIEKTDIFGDEHTEETVETKVNGKKTSAEGGEK